MIWLKAMGTGTSRATSPFSVRPPRPLHAELLRFCSGPVQHILFTCLSRESPCSVVTCPQPDSSTITSGMDACGNKYTGAGFSCPAPLVLNFNLIYSFKKQAIPSHARKSTVKILPPLPFSSPAANSVMTLIFPELLFVWIYAKTCK